MTSDFTVAWQFSHKDRFFGFRVFCYGSNSMPYGQNLKRVKYKT
jgi:hypothetical protein